MVVQVVEITKGSKVKYELDKKTGLIKVGIVYCVKITMVIGYCIPFLKSGYFSFNQFSG